MLRTVISTRREFCVIRMLEKLFSPLRIGPITIKNRIQVTPHELQYLSDGLVTERLIDYYAERAKGGVGLLEVSRLDVKEPTGVVTPEWKDDSTRRFPFVSKPEIVLGLRRLTESVHAYDSKIFMEVAA